MIEWVKQCASPQGGFGIKPGMEPDILHTGAALGMFQCVGQVPQIDSDIHFEWLRNQIQEDVNVSLDCHTTHNWLLRMAHCVQAVADINYIDCISDDLRKRIIDISVLKWKNSHRCICCTKNIVTIIKILNSHERNIVLEEIRDNWLPKYERTLPKSRISATLKETYEIVDIISNLYPSDYLKRPCVIQLKDNWIKASKPYFQYYDELG
jgi:hypothetical protein